MQEPVKSFPPHNAAFRTSTSTYLAKDFGFCWGVERSITLAYEAVEHYPGKKLHITNELIHNPEVNDALQEMKISLIHKESNTGTKDFSPVGEGDVVILPAFGASYEEMEMLDKKVRKKKPSCEGNASFALTALSGSPQIATTLLNIFEYVRVCVVMICTNQP